MMGRGTPQDEKDLREECTNDTKRSMRDVIRQKQESERDIQRLEQERANLAYSPWIDYLIANEYFNQQSYERAFEEVNRSILRFVLFGMQPPAIAYRLKYMILLHHGGMFGALEGINKAIEMYPDYVDLHFFKGLLLFAKGDYPEAETVFRQCIAIGEDVRSYVTIKGVGSFQSWFYVGQCNEKMGQYVQARDAYMASLQISTAYSPAYQSLQNVLAFIPTELSPP